MSKKSVLLWMLLVLMALVGCSSGSKDLEEEPSPEPPVVEQLTEMPPKEPVLQYRVETVLHKDTISAEDGTPLILYSYSIPVLTVWREDGSEITEAKTAAEEQALTAAETFHERFANWGAEEELAGLAREAREHLLFNREQEIPWSGGYTQELNCAVTQTEHLISIYGTYYSYTGGAHPSSRYMSWNFDLETGSFFDPKLLGRDTKFQEEVAAEILRQAHEVREDGWYPAEMYWDDHEALIADWSSKAVYFDKSGMTVTFDAYELAPYAAGAQEFFLPYEWIKPYLSEDGQRLLGL